MSIISILTAVLLGSVTLPASLRAQTPDVNEAARRVVATTALAAKEYAEGVSRGVVVAAEEVEEAKLFLTEAKAAAGSLPEELEDVSGAIDSLLVLVGATADPALVIPLSDEIARRIGSVLGDLGEGAAPVRPDFEAAATLYDTRCASCHGATGGGDGPLAGQLDPPPADLASIEAMFDQAPLDSYRKIAIGVSGTAMPGFQGELSDEQQWGLAWYIQTLRSAARDRAEGERLLGASCPRCEKSNLPLLARMPATFADPTVHAQQSDEQLIQLLTAGALGKGVSPDSGQASRIVAFLRTLPFADSVPAANGALELALVRADLARALREAMAGRRAQAGRHAFDSYVTFEGVETDVALRDGRLAKRLEAQFAEFRARAGENGSSESLLTSFEVLRASLDEAEQLLAQKQSTAGLFTQSLILLLREGIEAMLIVAALAALVVRAGAPERRREIWTGVGWALAASLLTAVLLETVFRLSVAQQEILEGITMLAATAVLFFVSYWLVSKIEVRHWNAFVKKQVDRALTRGSAFALALTAFLAVYREGFETVLFYKALFINAGGQGSGAIGLGALVALVALAFIYVGIERFGLRIPLRPFFAVTSAVLIYMAVTFAGRGIAELQESTFLRTTLLDWAPSLPWLGIYPTAQSLALQATLLALVGAALLWTFVVEPRYARSRVE